MAAPVRLDTMRAIVRRRANIENQTAFITDAEIDAELNSNLSATYDLLVGVGGQDWYIDRRTFNTSSSTDTYPLADIADNFYRMVAVDVLLSSTSDTTDVLTARPFMWPERNRYKMGPGWRVGYPLYYRMEGSNLVFIPQPPGTFRVRIIYHPIFKALVQDSDTFDGVNGWEDHAVWATVAYCKSKGDEDPSYAIGQVNEHKDRILQLAQNRDAGAPERPGDVMGSYERVW